MRAIVFGLPTFATLAALASVGFTEVEFKPFSEDELTAGGGATSKSPMEKLDDVVAVATCPGNAYANDYLLGMANGLILAKATLTDNEAQFMRMQDKPKGERPAEQAQTDQPREVLSEDFHVSIDKVLEALDDSNDRGEVQAIVAVMVGSSGDCQVLSSEGTPLALNLLRQGRVVIEGLSEHLGLTPDDEPADIQEAGGANLSIATTKDLLEELGRRAAQAAHVHTSTLDSLG